MHRSAVTSPGSHQIRSGSCCPRDGSSPAHGDRVEHESEEPVRLVGVVTAGSGEFCIQVLSADPTELPLPQWREPAPALLPRT